MTPSDADLQRQSPDLAAPEALASGIRTPPPPLPAGATRAAPNLAGPRMRRPDPSPAGSGVPVLRRPLHLFSGELPTKSGQIRSTS